MTPNNIIISIAFQSALTKFDRSLPLYIQTELNDIGNSSLINLANISRLDVVAESYPPLDKLYQEELKRLRSEIGERNKGLPPLPISNEPTAELSNMVIVTLKSNDSVSAAKKKENLSFLKSIWRQIVSGEKFNESDDQ